MNPLIRLLLYIGFSISTLLSKSEELIIIHILVVVGLMVLERENWNEWKFCTRPFWKYFPMTGVIFLGISFLVSSRPISVIITDVAFATIRMMVLVSAMAFYTIQCRSNEIITALRSVSFKMNLKWRMVEDLLLFFDMTVRFYPSLQEEWRRVERSKKALAIRESESFITRTIQDARFIPDFIVMNLERSKTLTQVMEMRGYATTIPRSVYPVIPMTFADIFWTTITCGILVGVHTFA